MTKAHSNPTATLESRVMGYSFLLDIKRYQWEFLILFLSSILLYANTLSHDYALDDQLAIYENKFVTKGVSGIGDILTHDAFEGFFGERGSKLISGGRYRPLSFVSFAIEWEIFGRNPHVSHAINVLLYGLLCCSLFYFLALLFPISCDSHSKYSWLHSLPFAAALLYCFHPIHTEVVANIKGRDEILCLLFGLWALIYFLQYFQSNSWKSYVILFLLYFLSLMSKENAITFLAVFPLAHYIQKGTLGLNNLKPYLSIFLACFVFIFLRIKYTQVGVDAQTTEILNNPFVRASASEKWGTILYSFLRYDMLLFFPHPLTHDYYFNQIPYRKLSDGWVLLSIITRLGFLYLAFRYWRERSPVFFAVAFFIITFSLVSNVFFTVGIIMNERFVFISSIGFCVLAAWILQRLDFKFGNVLYYSILFVILGLYSYKTIARNQVWKDNATLFSNDFLISQNSAKVATSFGGGLYEAAVKMKDSAQKNRTLDSSLLVLEHALKIYPENSQTWLLYANAKLAKTGNYRDALDIYKHCMELRGNQFFDASYNMAILYYNAGIYDSALIHIETANAINSEHKEAKAVYSRTLAKLGRTQEALATGGVDNANLSQLAMDAKDGGNYQEALSLAEQALALNPKDAIANYVKGICLARFMNRLPEGIPYLEKAIQYNTQNANWYEDLAVAYGIMGRIPESIPLLEKAIAIHPTAALYQNLATSYNKLGNKAKAEHYMQLARSK